MRITDIKQQIKRKDRYSIFADGKYLLSLSEAELLSSGINIGSEFSNKEKEELLQRGIIDKAYDQSLNLIMRRPRSEWEIRSYLMQKKLSEHNIEKAIKKLKERGYIDDLDFAKRWIENRRLLKSTSKRKLTLELRQKRVSDENVSIAMNEDLEEDKEVLRTLIEKKRRQSRYRDNQKLMAYLSRQGFSYDDIKSALEEAQE